MKNSGQPTRIIAAVLAAQRAAWWQPKTIPNQKGIHHVETDHEIEAGQSFCAGHPQLPASTPKRRARASMRPVKELPAATLNKPAIACHNDDAK